MNFHPDVLTYFARVAALLPPLPPALTVENARAAHRAIAANIGPARAIKTVRNFTVPGPRGEIACRLYSDQEANVAAPADFPARRRLDRR